MKRNLFLSVALCAFAAPMFTQAALSQDQGREIVGICEIPPDFFEGNCPPTVADYFDGLKAQGVEGDRFNTALIDATVALGERLQRAEAEKDIPLCIDIAEGILQTAAYSQDPGQREAIARLAEASCCVRVNNLEYGQLVGAARELPITGLKTDGNVQDGAMTFSSASASFVADDVRAGDLLVIKSGDQQGFYVIAAATSADTLTLQQGATVSFAGWAESEAPLVFEIRRVELPLEDNMCDPGGAAATTASIILESAPASDE